MFTNFWIAYINYGRSKQRRSLLHMHNIVKRSTLQNNMSILLILPIMAILFLYSQFILSIKSQTLVSFSPRILISARMLAYRHTSKILTCLVFLIPNFPDDYKESWHTIYDLRHGKKKTVKLHSICLSHNHLDLIKVKICTILKRKPERKEI